MAINNDRQEAFRIAKEKVLQKKEQEAREEKEFYERATSGPQWKFFKVIVVFCSLMALITTVDFIFDGPTKKLPENAWKIDGNWEYRWHAVLDVEGYMFTPHYENWSDHDENTLEMTYSPIFQVGKKLCYSIREEDSVLRYHEEYRQRSIFNWFPGGQIFMLIPLFTFLFRRQSAWFNFARITSMIIVFPGTLMLIYFATF